MPYNCRPTHKIPSFRKPRSKFIKKQIYDRSRSPSEPFLFLLHRTIKSIGKKCNPVTCSGMQGACLLFSVFFYPSQCPVWLEKGRPSSSFMFLSFPSNNPSSNVLSRTRKKITETSILKRHRCYFGYLETNHRQKILIRLIRWVQTSILQTEICFFKSQGNQKRQTTSCNKKMGGPKPDCIGMAKIVLAWISNGNQCCEISNMFC